MGKPASLALGSAENPLSPAEQRAQILRPLELVKAVPWFFALRLPDAGSKRYRQESRPPLGCMSAEYPPCVPARVMFGFVAIACPRLVAVPRKKRAADRTTWRWAGCVMDRVVRGLVCKLQVRLRALARAGYLTRTAANAG